MLFEAYIAGRLSLRRDADGAKGRSAGSVIAVAGIALAIAIMLLSVAVVTGFKREIRERLTGFNAPLTVYPVDAFDDTAVSQGITLTDTLAAIFAETVAGAAPELTIRQSAIFKTDDAFQGIVLKGSAGKGLNDFIARHIVEGRGLPSGNNLPDSLQSALVVSRKIADALKTAVGDRLTVHFLHDNNMRTRRMTVRGIYDSHFSEYDALYAFTTPAFLQQLNKVDSMRGSEIELRGIDAMQAPEKAAELDSRLLAAGLENSGRRRYLVDNVVDSCSLYFNWLSLLDTNVAVIIVLMTLVAAFTLISSLFIIILERVGFIGLFKAMGATNAAIRRIFIILAERLVARGLLWGNVIGLGIMALQWRFHLIPLDPESYYLDYVPVAFSPGAIIAINLCAVAVSTLVLILPSHLIARLSPAETMRFE